MADLVEAAKEADLIIFVVPHQFVRTICSTLLGQIKPTAVALSLIKVKSFYTILQRGRYLILCVLGRSFGHLAAQLSSGQLSAARWCVLNPFCPSQIIIFCYEPGLRHRGRRRYRLNIAHHHKTPEDPLRCANGS